MTLEISASTHSAPSATYAFTRSDGSELARVTTFGVDTVQALMFCLTAAGDYLKRYVPSASFAETGVTWPPDHSL